MYQQISKTAFEFTSDLHYIVNATLSTSCAASARFLLTIHGNYRIGEKVSDSLRGDRFPSLSVLGSFR